MGPAKRIWKHKSLWFWINENDHRKSIRKPEVDVPTLMLKPSFSKKIKVSPIFRPFPKAKFFFGKNIKTIERRGCFIGKLVP